MGEVNECLEEGLPVLLLGDQIDAIDLAKALLEYETLSGDEIINVIKGVAPKREEADSPRALGPAVAVPISPRPGHSWAVSVVHEPPAKR